MELELEHTFESVDREAPELVTEADPDETVAAVGGQDAADHPPVLHSAANRSIGSTTGCTITENAHTRAFSWLKAPTSAFTFKTFYIRPYVNRVNPWAHGK